MVEDFSVAEGDTSSRTTVTDCSLRSGQLSGCERLMVVGGNPVAEGDTPSTDDRHRLSPAERKTVGGRRLPKPRRRLLRADAHKKRSQPQ